MKDGLAGEAATEPKRSSAERYVPGQMFGLIQAEHEARYRWAASIVRDRVVLDAGCGVGYGSDILLAAGARRVVAIDIAADAVETARTEGASAIEFAPGDLRRLPFPDDSFDVVACFEVIEHIEEQDAVLDEFARVLRPAGVLLVSSPNRKVYLPGNPHHVRELTPDELEGALRGRFSQVQLFRQQPSMASLIVDDEEFAIASADEQLAVTVRKTVGGVPGEEVYTLAAASQSGLPQLQGVAVLTDTVDFRAWNDTVQGLTVALEAARARTSLRSLAHELPSGLLRKARRAAARRRGGNHARNGRR